MAVAIESNAMETTLTMFVKGEGEGEEEERWCGMWMRSVKGVCGLKRTKGG
jgi:hypothetical protein